MELGSLICKPKQPLCNLCPINSLCISFKKKNFEIIKKFKKNKTKYFEANIYYSKNKILLIKNEKYNFLKNHLIFPMDEINKYKFFSSSKIKTSIKISNIDMKIIINKNNKIVNAILDLKSRDLIISGVPEIKLSNARNVFIFPSSKLITVKKNRDFVLLNSVLAKIKIRS